MNRHASPTAPTLTTPEFFARVHALTPRVAVFDCDGTLWSGDAGSTFMRWSMERGLLSPEKTDWLNDRYAGYRRGDGDELAICGNMVQVYAGLSVDDLRRAAATFFCDVIEPHIFPEMLRLVRELQSRNVEIWAVSSTCDWVVEEGVKRFDIPSERVLAACVECSEGLATATLRDVPTDEGKVSALRRVGITAPDAVFGNSVHDAAMLALARGPFPVNASPALQTLATERGWPLYFPAAVAPAFR